MSEPMPMTCECRWCRLARRRRWRRLLALRYVLFPHDANLVMEEIRDDWFAGRLTAAQRAREEAGVMADIERLLDVEAN